jgi:hypothetical protein
MERQMERGLYQCTRRFGTCVSVVIVSRLPAACRVDEVDGSLKSYSNPFSADRHEALGPNDYSMTVRKGSRLKPIGWQKGYVFSRAGPTDELRPRLLSECIIPLQFPRTP